MNKVNSDVNIQTKIDEHDIHKRWVSVEIVPQYCGSREYSSDKTSIYVVSEF